MSNENNERWNKTSGRFLRSFLFYKNESSRISIWWKTTSRSRRIQINLNTWSIGIILRIICFTSMECYEHIQQLIYYFHCIYHCIIKVGMNNLLWMTNCISTFSNKVNTVIILLSAWGRHEIDTLWIVRQFFQYIQLVQVYSSCFYCFDSHLLVSDIRLYRLQLDECNYDLRLEPNHYLFHIGMFVQPFLCSILQYYEYFIFWDRQRIVS